MNDAEGREEATDLEDVRAALASHGGAVGLAAHLNEGIFESSGLDARTFFLVRAAAMAAMGAGPTAWGVTTELMDEEVSADDLLGVLTAIAPIIGTTRLVLAAENLIGS
jgi:alkylhydroperoxidase/carboxymuconolactone decarboxylase family protein YurZ